MIRAVVIVIIVVTALMIFSIIDCSRTEEGKIRSLPKWAWLVIILFVPGIGSIAWLIAGRPKGPGRGGRRKKKVIPPDDNPDWLRKL
jgi:hypothetical protein